jgi:lipopolysaccharide transport system ATP-binding protein
MLCRGRKQFFREFWALNNVSVEINKGETVGILGRNGSGKSTLLQAICGTLNPTQGTIRTYGRIAALLELGSGFNPEFSGRENVYLNAAILGLTVAETNVRFDDIIAFADIGDFLDQPVKTYSSGMVVRLAFAVAINVDPQILVVDEALSVGDELFQRKCFSRIESLRAKGTTILFVSHSGSTIVELCDRAVLLDSGELLASGSPKSIVGNYQKLLYAPMEKRELIREEIRSGLIHAEIEKNSTLVGDGIANGTRHVANAGAREIYDPSLQPTSTIVYESQGACIETPKVVTADSEQINNLVRGGSYRYVYRVTFTEDVANVRFGMLIKTTSGVELGGAVSAESARSSITNVSAGSRYEVEFSFRCALNPGVYFMNAGVVGEVGGNEGYLHRITDAAMFRVLPEQANRATGIIDFDCRPFITVLEN